MTLKNEAGLLYLCTVKNKVMSELTIHTKLENLPEDLKNQVNDFVDFLLEKSLKSKAKVYPKFGSVKGKIKMAADFDAPLDDFKEYM